MFVYHYLFLLVQAILLCLSFETPVHGIALTPSQSLTTTSGLKVSPYGLGGAARSTQPSSLPSLYFDEITSKTDFAPFYFYYNPHRYQPFMSGIKELCSSNSNRDDIFVASGGTDRSIDGLDQRFSDCLEYCGGKYLDLFFLEYVEPEELDHADRTKPGTALAFALKHVQKWKEKGLIRYVGISTHSHEVGSFLSSVAEVDVLMLRYGMSHKDAAERISFPAAKENCKPVIAFTSTRWNSLQAGIDDKDQWPTGDAPTSAACLNFVFGSKSSPVVEAVLHSARDEEELLQSMADLRYLSHEEERHWRAYGQIFEIENKDGFDEYPEERRIC